MPKGKGYKKRKASKKEAYFTKRHGQRRGASLMKQKRTQGRKR